MSTDRVLVKLYAIAASAQAVQAVLVAISLFLLARLLAPAELGIYLLLLAAAAIASVLIAAGPQAAHLIIASRSPDERAELHGQGLAIAVGALVAVAVVCIPFADDLAPLVSPSIDGRHVWLAALTVPPLVYGGALHALLTGSGLVGLAARMNVIQAGTGFGAPVGAAVAADPLLGTLAGGLAGTLGWALAAGAMTTARTGILAPADRSLWRAAFGLGLPLHIGNAGYWLMQRLDLFVLNTVAGPAAVGVYGMARVLGEKTSVLIAPLHLAVSWRISGDERAASRHIMLLLVRTLMVVGTAMFLAAVVLGGPLLEVLAGSEYRDGGLPFALLVPTGIILGTWSVVALFIASQLRRPWLTAALQVGSTAVAAILYVVLALSLGPNGVAVGVLLSASLLLTTGLLAVKRLDRLRLADVILSRGDVRDAIGAARQLLRRQASLRARGPRQRGGA